ncbi:MAG: HAD family hydrolase [Candidatus Lokiarchaeota archaeon]|nr:HAD family hydrolase [Candidatus Lokiarchaeota archaeon]
MKYKAIIFDLFGTLVDSYSVQGYNRLLTDMASALELPVEDFSKLWRDTTYERGTGIFKTTEDSIKYICNMLKVSVSEEKIKKCEQIRQDTTTKALTPKNGAVDVLKCLKGLEYKIGLITNCSAEVPLLWENTEFSHLFDVTIFSASVGLKKPDAQIYNLACEQLGVDPNECLYFGDGDSNELSGASQLGMDAVMIRDPNELDPYRLVEVEWDGRKIENFKEIMDLI